MFQKVLLVEDLDSIGVGIAQMLQQKTTISSFQKSSYCDDAFLKFQRALLDNEPFDLLITDLSFKTDHRNCKIGSGDELVKILRAKQPNLKTIIYSVEDRASKIKSFFKTYNIDGYVVKGRHGLKYLTEAIDALAKNETYFSPDLAYAMRSKEVFEIEDYDIELITLLSQGLTQDEISFNLKEKGIRPSGVSSIEKRLNKLKLEFRAKNAIQLVAMVKDLGLV